MIDIILGIAAIALVFFGAVLLFALAVKGCFLIFKFVLG